MRYSSANIGTRIKFMAFDAEKYICCQKMTKLPKKKGQKWINWTGNCGMNDNCNGRPAGKKNTKKDGVEQKLWAFSVRFWDSQEGIYSGFWGLRVTGIIVAQPKPWTVCSPNFAHLLGTTRVSCRKIPSCFWAIFLIFNPPCTPYVGIKIIPTLGHGIWQALSPEQHIQLKN